MRVNRGLVFWGLALVTAGAVALLVQSGSIAEEAAREAWRFWPVALIVAGLAIIAARTPFALVATAVAGIVVGGLAGTLVAGWPAGLSIGCGGEPTETVTESGSFGGDSAEVDLRFNCGDLAVSMIDGSDWSLDARHGRDERPEVGSTDSSLRVSAEGGGVVGFSDIRQEWEVELPSGVELDLAVEANASSNRLDLVGGSFTALRFDTNAGSLEADLSGATIGDFEVEMNAGSVSFVTDGETSLAGSVDMNAGSMELCAPDGAVVEIALDDPNVTFSHNLADRDFDESGSTWTLGTGAPDISLEVDGNAASFNFNPDGGCE